MLHVWTFFVMLCSWKDFCSCFLSFRLFLWCVTVTTKYCFYKYEQLISISKAQLKPEQWPQISEEFKKRLHGCRGRKFKTFLWLIRSIEINFLTNNVYGIFGDLYWLKKIFFNKNLTTLLHLNIACSWKR